MAQFVELDDDVFLALQERAQPLIDDVNSVLRRVLALDSATRGASADGGVETPREATPKPKRDKPRRGQSPGARAERGSLLPEADYEMPLLSALVARGGSAPASRVIDDVGEALEPRLTDVDREILKSGLLRWKSRTQFVRLKLIQSGDMASGSPRGVWEITEAGRERVVKNVDRG